MPGNAVDLNVRVGDVIRAWREYRGWTLTELAERTGLPITKGYLSELENGKILQPRSMTRLSKLAAALGITESDIHLRTLPTLSSQSPTPRQNKREHDERDAPALTALGHRNSPLSLDDWEAPEESANDPRATLQGLAQRLSRIATDPTVTAHQLDVLAAFVHAGVDWFTRHNSREYRDGEKE